MIVFVGLIVFIFSSTAVARTPSVEIVEAGVLDVDVLGKTPSLEIGIYPFNSDPDRKSLIWNAFPEPLQDEFFEKTPSLEMAVPLNDEIVRKTPSLDMGFYPIDWDPDRKSLLWNAFPQPLQEEIFERLPSQAVREPLDIECCGPTMRFDLKEDVSAEILIYSVNGRLVRRLTEALPSGESALTWDGKDDRGNRAASGVYFARVQANTDTGKAKLVLIH